jgi:RimJ/RimL family protein N-acetyltransferase
MTTAAAGAVVRFAFGGLGLHRLTWRHAAGNVASQRLAAALGFVPEGRLREAWPVDGRRDDVLVHGRLATDV